MSYNQDNEIAQLRTEVDRLTKILNTPLYDDFVEAVKTEAPHQAWRWSKQDEQKSPEEWYNLIEYLSGKALQAHSDGNRKKALHHTISSAAALLHWHTAISRQFGPPNDP